MRALFLYVNFAIAIGVTILVPDMLGDLIWVFLGIAAVIAMSHVVSGGASMNMPRLPRYESARKRRHRKCLTDTERLERELKIGPKYMAQLDDEPSGLSLPSQEYLAQLPDRKINPARSIHRHIRAYKTIYQHAESEGRDPNAEERLMIEHHLCAIEQLKAMRMRDLRPANRRHYAALVENHLMHEETR